MSYSLLLLHVLLSCLMLCSLYMLIRNPLLDQAPSALNHLKSVSYFGFSVFFLVNLGFLLSEFVKSRQKRYSFASKFAELHSLRTSREKVSIVLDAAVYLVHLGTFALSYLLGRA